MTGPQLLSFARSFIVAVAHDTHSVAYCRWPRARRLMTFDLKTTNMYLLGQSYTQATGMLANEKTSLHQNLPANCQIVLPPALEAEGNCSPDQAPTMCPATEPPRSSDSEETELRRLSCGD